MDAFDRTRPVAVSTECHLSGATPSDGAWC